MGVRRIGVAPDRHSGAACGSSGEFGFRRRPISVPASQAVMRPWLRGSRVNTIPRRSVIARVDLMRPASSSRCSCRAVAGRLIPISCARLDGRRGRIAMAAISRRRVGSASSSIPGPFFFGISGRLRAPPIAIDFDSGEPPSTGSYQLHIPRLLVHAPATLGTSHRQHGWFRLLGSIADWAF